MNKEKAIRPEDVLPDDDNHVTIQGMKIRKGTIAAVMKNAETLISPSASEGEKKEAKKMIAELAPALVVLGVYDHVIWKNPDIQQEVEAAAEKLKKRQRYSNN